MTDTARPGRHPPSRVDATDWRALADELDPHGSALTGRLLTSGQCGHPRLLSVAQDWVAKLGRPAPWPDTLGEWIAMCHESRQAKSAQILLRYGAGDWNALHRDVFGDMVFPLQVVIGLDVPGTDFSYRLVIPLSHRCRCAGRRRRPPPKARTTVRTSGRARRHRRCPVRTGRAGTSRRRATSAWSP